MSDHPSHEVGAALRDVLGPGPDAARLAAQRARLVEWESTRKAASTSIFGALFSARGLLSLGAVGALATLSLWLAWGPSSNSDATLAQTSPPASGPAESPKLAATTSVLTAQHADRWLSKDAWLNADRAPVAVDFSDQSRIDLAVGAQARLTELDEQRVRLTLESGTLDARVTPGGSRVWEFVAGPYRVTVLGTQLSVNWQPLEQQLRVAVMRGKVRVSGGRIDGEGRVVAAGESLNIEPPPAPEDGSDAAPAPDGAIDSSAIDGSMGSAVPPPKGPSSGRVRSLPSPGQPKTTSWKHYAKQGEFDKALEAADAAGFQSLTQTVNASDLLLLADSARLGGSVAKARTALTTLRSRFPNHPNALVAAFTLGRLAYEVEGNNAQAVRWFRVYLRGAPSGSLAEGARGRLLQALSRIGDQAGAREAAASYLKHHPNGPHAGKARSLLSKK